MNVLYNQMMTAKDADEAFVKWFYKMKNESITEGEKQKSRDGDVVAEIINAITFIEDPTRCFMVNKIRKLPLRYTIGELLWYESANNSLKGIQNFSKNWDRMSDDGQTVNSNYGHCIIHKFGFNQWNFVKELLHKNPETRQAVIHIKEARDLINNPSKDVNCTVCLQFFIRNEKLHLTVYMRSNDFWMGFPYDVFQFTAMQIKMAMELNIDIGSYTHIDGSLHFYDRDFQTALKNIQEIEVNK